MAVRLGSFDRRRLVRVVGRSLALAGPSLVGAVYLGTRILTDAPRHRAPRQGLRARFHEDATPAPSLVQLEGREASVPGRWGLVFDGGFAQVTDPVEATLAGTGVPRPYETLEGVAPTAAVQSDRRACDRRTRDRRTRDRQTRSPDGRGQQRRGGDRRGWDRRRRRTPPPWPVRAALHPYAWPADPQICAVRHNAQWWIDAVPTDRGYLPAWRFTPIERRGVLRDTWVIGVHGRGAQRAELFRLIATALGAGATCAVVSYRTDAWVHSPAPRTTLGLTEWRDVEAAVRLAFDEGARRVVLAGCSLGGALVATFLRRSSLAGRIDGVVLDSPALQWNAILEHVAQARRVPRPLIPVIMQVARMRARIDWDALDHVGAAAEFRHRILLLHGTADPVVPVWLSEAFAQARPDLVTYVQFEGAGHVRAWNADPARYEDAVRRFLLDVTGAPKTHAASSRGGRRKAGALR